MNDLQILIDQLCKIGQAHRLDPRIQDVKPFAPFFLPDGSLDLANLDERDGSCTRRELLVRFLFINAVLDQGPDIIGIRKMLIDVTNTLYLQEVRFLHKPAVFFDELGVAINAILETHKSIKEIRAEQWGAQNQSNPSKYNLFMDNSHQVLNYAVFRWGVPLAVPLLLGNDQGDTSDLSNLLIDYLEMWASAEIMSQQIKDHERYGLGKAIGDKAAHLFTKWLISSFHLARKTDINWGPLSYESPYDSNAGRVLLRTGYLFHWATEDEYIDKQVIQKGAGKQGLDYLRVTNIRGMKASAELPPDLWSNYIEIATRHLLTSKMRPQKAEIQRIQHAYLLENNQKTGYSIADYDDGLIYVGTNFCYNHSNPDCENCPIHDLCDGYTTNHALIEQYRT